MPNRRERGSVTAEFVLALPAVMLIIFLAIAVISVQVERLSMVYSASSISRAIARDEPVEIIDQMVSALGSKVSFELIEAEGRVCVILSRPVQFPMIQSPVLNLVETQCSLANGL